VNARFIDVLVRLMAVGDLLVVLKHVLAVAVAVAVAVVS
jgi:hypothetical protein